MDLRRLTDVSSGEDEVSETASELIFPPAVGDDGAADVESSSGVGRPWFVSGGEVGAGEGLTVLSSGLGWPGEANSGTEAVGTSVCSTAAVLTVARATLAGVVALFSLSFLLFGLFLRPPFLLRVFCWRWSVCPPPPLRLPPVWEAVVSVASPCG